jgi:hypothetical protein
MTKIVEVKFWIWFICKGHNSFLRNPFEAQEKSIVFVLSLG